MFNRPTTPSKLRMAMIGGGEGAFIGEIHRFAVALCPNIELVAGAFSSNAESSHHSGAKLGLAPQRVYDNYQQLIETEARLDEQSRVDFIAIVTPNHLHYPIAKLALESGFHVFCEKPLSHNLQQAQWLAQLVNQTGKQIGLNQVYLGYPLVSQAKHMIACGELGRIRKVFVDYPQSWLSQKQEANNNAQALWRTDPQYAGSAGCIADIGTHAFNLAEYIVGQEFTEVCADLTSFVDGRRLDDDGAALFRMSGGAKGVLTASQICSGQQNGLKISVFGESGSCQWQQEQPNTLLVSRQDQPTSTYLAGNDQGYLQADVRNRCRTPAGHPEGFIEAMANIYCSFAQLLQDQPNTVPACPNIHHGVRGMQFINAMVQSSDGGGVWTTLADTSPINP